MITTASPRAWSSPAGTHLVPKLREKRTPRTCGSAARGPGSAPTSGRASRRRRRRSPTSRPRRGAPPRGGRCSSGRLPSSLTRHATRVTGDISATQRRPDRGDVSRTRRRSRWRRSATTCVGSGTSARPRSQRPPPGPRPTTRAAGSAAACSRRELLRHRRPVLASQTTSGGLVLTGGRRPPDVSA